MLLLVIESHFDNSPWNTGVRIGPDAPTSIQKHSSGQVLSHHDFEAMTLETTSLSPHLHDFRNALNPNADRSPL